MMTEATRPPSAICSETDKEAKVGIIAGLRNIRCRNSLIGHFSFDNLTVFLDLKRIFRFVRLVSVQRIEFLIGVFPIPQSEFSDTVFVCIAPRQRFRLYRF